MPMGHGKYRDESKRPLRQQRSRRAYICARVARDAGSSADACTGRK